MVRWSMECIGVKGCVPYIYTLSTTHENMSREGFAEVGDQSADINEQYGYEDAATIAELELAEQGFSTHITRSHLFVLILDAQWL